MFEGSAVDLGMIRAEEEAERPILDFVANLVEDVEERIFEVILSKSRCLSLQSHLQLVSHMSESCMK